MSETSLTPYALYLAGAIGAAGLYLLLRPGPKQIRMAGTLIGIAGLAMLSAQVLRGMPSIPGGPGGDWPVLPLVFGAVAIAGATRMVTHPKPVFAALYFILVVVSSAGLFLLMQAEFMAFALVIVYAGAILITYMFVLMLAQQSPTETGVGGGDIEGGTLYDRVPREPLAAVAVGFLLLATLGDALLSPQSSLRYRETSAVAAGWSDRQWADLDAMPRALEAAVRRIDADAVVVRDENGRAITVAADGSATVRVTTTGVDGASEVRSLPLPSSALPTNTQVVGLALVSRFPASLELASVILLMAMFGAVVLARKQIELGEDERREAAGMRRLTLDEPEPGSRGGRP